MDRRSPTEEHTPPELKSRPLQSMNLFTRLLISHVLPVLVVTLALSVVLLALARISVLLTRVSNTELVALRDEGTMHRAAWGVEVQMRRGQTACTQGAQSSEVAHRIALARGVLEGRLAEPVAVSRPMREVARGYLAISAEVLAGDVCSMLRRPEVQTRRSQLDERITDLWVLRLVELHAAVGKKEESARRTAEVAMWAGIPLAGFSFALAMVLAAQMARLLKRPLASLAQTARRVGRGDFGMQVQVSGPMEIVALAEELEHMRTKLAQLDKLKQGFLASVSHELRTPLSKIREALALLSDGAVGELDARKARVVQIARTACEREIRMVTTLLDLSRLRTGSPLRLTNGSSLETVVQSATADERAEATSRGVTVDVKVALDGRRGRLDSVLMERAVANLIRNAVSVSKRGQRVEVACDIDAPVDAPPTFRLRVSDEGPGVPAAIRATVFDAFVTHEVPSSGKAIGVGIGLALAREVARAHGGDLVLLEDDRAGACFEMRLPIDDAPPEPSSLVRRSLGLSSMHSLGDDS